MLGDLLTKVWNRFRPSELAYEHPISISSDKDQELQDNYVAVHSIDILPEGVDSYHTSDPLRYRRQLILASTNIKEKYYNLIIGWGGIKSKKNDWHWKSYRIKRTRKKKWSKVIDVCHFKDQEIKGYMVTLPDGRIHYSNYDHYTRKALVRMEISDGADKKVQAFQVGDVEQKQDMNVLESRWFKNDSVEIRNYLKLKIKDISYLKDIWIVEPFLSHEIIDVLASGIMEDSNIKILFKKFAGKKPKKKKIKKEKRSLLNAVRTKLANHKIEIKQIVDETASSVSVFDPVRNPFHDRYILGKSSSLIIGTSFNSIV